MPINNHSGQKKAQKEKIVFSLLALSMIAVILPVLAVIYFLVTRGLSSIDITFLTTQVTTIDPSEGGIFDALIGTLYLLAGTLIFSVPVGILAAVYLTEYAPNNNFTRLIRLAIVNLAGVPSIVYGLFGLGLFVLVMNFGKSILSGSLTLAALILPVVITASEEALLTVPKSFRDGSLALGATKWQTIWRIVLPNSAAGIITGVILGIGRAAGETAPIIFTACVGFMSQLPGSPYDECLALPYLLYVVSSENASYPDDMKWGIATVLLILVLGMNIIATSFRARFRRSRTW